MGKEEIAEEKGGIVCRYPKYIRSVGLYAGISIGTILPKTCTFTFQARSLTKRLDTSPPAQIQPPSSAHQPKLYPINSIIRSNFFLSK